MAASQRRRSDHRAAAATAADETGAIRGSTPDSRDDIARRAYELYERRGGEHGHDWDDWFQAESERRHGPSDVEPTS